MRDIDNSQNVLDSRDVQKTFDDLNDERDDLINTRDEAKAALDGFEPSGDEEKDTDDKEALEEALQEAQEALEEWEGDNEDGWKALKDFCEEGEQNSSDWSHGETLIRESYFKDYCEELCEDIGDLPKEMPSYLVIDWDATAENLKADYSTITWDGVEYYIRSC